jgi:hypothetical protein
MSCSRVPEGSIGRAAQLPQCLDVELSSSAIGSCLVVAVPAHPRPVPRRCYASTPAVMPKHGFACGARNHLVGASLRTSTSGVPLFQTLEITGIDRQRNVRVHNCLADPRAAHDDKSRGRPRGTYLRGLWLALQLRCAIVLFRKSAKALHGKPWPGVGRRGVNEP